MAHAINALSTRIKPAQHQPEQPDQQRHHAEPSTPKEDATTRADAAAHRSTSTERGDINSTAAGATNHHDHSKGSPICDMDRLTVHGIAGCADVFITAKKFLSNGLSVDKYYGLMHKARYVFAAAAQQVVCAADKPNLASGSKPGHTRPPTSPLCAPSTHTHAHTRMHTHTCSIIVLLSSFLPSLVILVYRFQYLSIGLYACVTMHCTPSQHVPPGTCWYRAARTQRATGCGRRCMPAPFRLWKPAGPVSETPLSNR